MVDNSLDIIKTERRKHENKIQKIERMREKEEERHAEKMNEIYNNTYVSDIKDELKQLSSKRYEITTFVEDKIFELLRDAIGIYLCGKYTGERLTIDKSLTVRDKYLYSYGDSRKATKIQIMSNLDGLSETIRDWGDNVQRETMLDVLALIEANREVLEEVTNHFEPFYYRQTDSSEYKYIALSIGDKTFAFVNEIDEKIGGRNVQKRNRAKEINYEFSFHPPSEDAMLAFIENKEEVRQMMSEARSDLRTIKEEVRELKDSPRFKGLEEYLVYHRI